MGLYKLMEGERPWAEAVHGGNIDVPGLHPRGDVRDEHPLCAAAAGILTLIILYVRATPASVLSRLRKGLRREGLEKQENKTSLLISPHLREQGETIVCCP